MCASPRPDKHPSNENSDVGDDVQQEPAPARPVMDAGKTRECSRSRQCLPLERVAWLSGHCVAASGFGQQESFSVRDCTGDCRKQPGFGENESIIMSSPPPVCPQSFQLLGWTWDYLGTEDEVPTQGHATVAENEDISNETAPTRRTPTRTKTPLLLQSVFL